MSDQIFEVAFSGKIMEGANLDEVKARLGKMFNADDAKLAQLFSGKRVVIKKNIDQATADKYKTALNRAGAECELSSSGGVAATPTAAASDEPAAAPPEPTASTTPASTEYETAYDGDVEPPPQIDPLGITGDQIEDLAASLAPVGSELQDDHQDPEAPEIDTAGLDVAPAGSDIGSTKKEADPPPPDTSGITLAD